VTNIGLMAAAAMMASWSGAKPRGRMGASPIPEGGRVWVIRGRVYQEINTRGTLRKIVASPWPKGVRQ